MKKSYLLNIVKNFNIPYYFSTAHNRLINDCQNKDDFFHFLEKKKGYLIKTSCDTELIAPGYKFYGEKFFSLIEGMFAFAICDLSKNKLIISRDRYGTKPLYYSIIDNELYFSSRVVDTLGPLSIVIALKSSRILSDSTPLPNE